MIKPKQPLILLRHAQAQHHVRGITGGWSDTDLTASGIRQAECLAARLERELAGISIQLGSSGLRRAVHTARIIESRLGSPAQVYEPLTDLNNGIAAGKTHAEARRHAIPPSEPVLDWQPYPEAESWRQFFIRVSSFMNEFSSQQASPAVLVTHAATIHVIIAWWLSLPVETRVQFSIAPASITVLSLNQWGECSLERMNDTAHLYELGMTNPIQLTSLT